MTYVILASSAAMGLLEIAAVHLRKRGHRVDVTGDADQALSLVSKERPNVIVLSSMLRKKSGWTLVEDIQAQFPDAQTQFVWIASLDETTGEPIVDWANLRYANILTFPPSEWDIVLAAEQLIFRSVTQTPSQQTLAVFERLVTWFLRYLKRKQGRFPSMTDSDAVENALVSEYKFLKGQIQLPNPSHQFCPNPKLSDRTWESLEASVPMLLFYEEPPQQDGTRWAAFVEGKLEQLCPRFERVTEVHL